MSKQLRAEIKRLLKEGTFKRTFTKEEKEEFMKPQPIDFLPLRKKPKKGA